MTPRRKHDLEMIALGVVIGLAALAVHLAWTWPG
jgi:hypothetical protein